MKGQDQDHWIMVFSVFPKVIGKLAGIPQLYIQFVVSSLWPGLLQTFKTFFDNIFNQNKCTDIYIKLHSCICTLWLHV